MHSKQSPQLWGEEKEAKKGKEKNFQKVQVKPLSN